MRADALLRPAPSPNAACGQDSGSHATEVCVQTRSSPTPGPTEVQWNVGEPISVWHLPVEAYDGVYIWTSVMGHVPKRRKACLDRHQTAALPQPCLEQPRAPTMPPR